MMSHFSRIEGKKMPYIVCAYHLINVLLNHGKGEIEEAPLRYISGPSWCSLFTNGALAACLHRSQDNTAEGFLLSTNQDLPCSDSSSNLDMQRPLNHCDG